ncbi:MAG: transcriptional regulator [Phycisphaerales bacterium]
MDEQHFQSKFTELMNRIKELPEAERSRLEQMADDTRRRRERLQSSITELQDSLDHLRLTVKYLVFDLEATRRENNYLRKMLEEANRRRQPMENQDELQDEDE